MPGSGNRIVGFGKRKARNFGVCALLLFVLLPGPTCGRGPTCWRATLRKGTTLRKGAILPCAGMWPTARASCLGHPAGRG